MIFLKGCSVFKRSPFRSIEEYKQAASVLNDSTVLEASAQKFRLFFYIL